MSIQTRWVTSIEELRALGPRYDAMALAAGDAGLFYQLGWLERVWPYYRTRLGGTLSFLIVEGDGELLALAPLTLGTKDWLHARQRVLGFLGGTWDELDNWMPAFLFATRRPDERAGVMRAIVSALADRPWDLLGLRFVRPDCPSQDALRARYARLRATPNRLTIPRARLDRGWAAYWTGRSKRLTRILDRGRRRAADDGLELVYETTADVAVERRAEAEAIHRARQEQIRAGGRARTSPFDDPHARQVFWSLIDFAASRGQLRTHWLRIGGRTAAYVVALHHAGTSFAYFNTIDPAAERYHPGSLVLAAMIEREASEFGARIIDMMAGSNLTKTLFATEEMVTTDLTIVNPGRVRAMVSDGWIRAVRRLARTKG